MDQAIAFSIVTKKSLKNWNELKSIKYEGTWHFGSFYLLFAIDVFVSLNIYEIRQK